MMKNKAVSVAILTILLSNVNSFAELPNSTLPKTDLTKADSAKASANNTDASQKIIDDFQAYAGSIKPEIRTEIRKYREEIVAINKKKCDLYNSLSQEAQSFLIEQQKYKKKISIVEENQANSPSSDKLDKNKPK
ncbi:hypothetical protein [Rickettsia endosymbiont of Polydrusus tereticollis]|uniref:hypothetical protein n=1 Tax=Rickettsia endosymbiont of Polydrusus tereticollis TaxID=3066251 RepID=UPI0031335368